MLCHFKLKEFALKTYLVICNHKALINCYYNYFMRIIYPEWDYAVSEAAAYNHVCIAGRILSLIHI